MNRIHTENIQRYQFCQDSACCHRHDFVPRMRHEIVARPSNKTNDTTIYILNSTNNPFWLNDTNGTSQSQNKQS